MGKDFSENKFCVYVHRRPDTMEVFYVGIGSGNRPYRTNNRNKWWQNIVDKNNGNFIVDILDRNLPWELCCAVEKNLIEKYGRKDKGTGILVNLTYGGEGAYGMIHSEKTKKKMSLLKKGKPLTKEHIKKIVEANKGRKWSDETRVKMLNSIRGVKKPISQTTRMLISRLRLRGYVIEQVCLLTSDILNTFSSARAAGKSTGIVSKNITDVTLGKANTAGGYFWRKCYDANKVELQVEILKLILSDINLIQSVV